MPDFAESSVVALRDCLWAAIDIPHSHSMVPGGFDVTS